MSFLVSERNYPVAATNERNERREERPGTCHEGDKMAYVMSSTKLLPKLTTFSSVFDLKKANHSILKIPNHKYLKTRSYFSIGVT